MKVSPRFTFILECCTQKLNLLHHLQKNRTILTLDKKVSENKTFRNF